MDASAVGVGGCCSSSLGIQQHSSWKMAALHTRKESIQPPHWGLFSLPKSHYIIAGISSVYVFYLTTIMKNMDYVCIVFSVVYETRKSM